MLEDGPAASWIPGDPPVRPRRPPARGASGPLAAAALTRPDPVACATERPSSVSSTSHHSFSFFSSPAPTPFGASFSPPIFARLVTGIPLVSGMTTSSSSTNAFLIALTEAIMLVIPPARDVLCGAQAAIAHFFAGEELLRSGEVLGRPQCGNAPVRAPRVTNDERQESGHHPRTSPRRGRVS